MTITEYQRHLASSLRKVRAASGANVIVEFTEAERATIEAALDIAGGICDVLAKRDAKPGGEK